MVKLALLLLVAVLLCGLAGAHLRHASHVTPKHQKDAVFHRLRSAHVHHNVAPKSQQLDLEEEDSTPTNEDDEFHSVGEWNGEDSAEDDPVANPAGDGQGYLRVDVDTKPDARPFVVSKVHVDRRSATHTIGTFVLTPSPDSFIIRLYHKQKEVETAEAPLLDILTEIELWFHSVPITVVVETVTAPTPSIKITVSNVNLRLFRYDQTGWSYPILSTLFGIQDARLVFTKTTAGTEKLHATMRRFGVQYAYDFGETEPLRISAPNALNYRADDPYREQGVINLKIDRNSWSIMSPRKLKGAIKLLGIYKKFELRGVRSVRRANNNKKADTTFYNRNIVTSLHEGLVFNELKHTALELDAATQVDVARKLGKRNARADPAEPERTRDFLKIGSRLHGLLFLCGLVQTSDGLVTDIQGYLQMLQSLDAHITEITATGGLNLYLQPTLDSSADAARRPALSLERTGAFWDWKLVRRATLSPQNEWVDLAAKSFPAVLGIADKLLYKITHDGAKTYSIDLNKGEATDPPKFGVHIIYDTTKSLVTAIVAQQQAALEFSRFDNSIVVEADKTLQASTALAPLRAAVDYSVTSGFASGSASFLGSFKLATVPETVIRIAAHNAKLPTLFLVDAAPWQGINLAHSDKTAVDMSLHVTTNGMDIRALVEQTLVKAKLQKETGASEATISFPKKLAVTYSGTTYHLEHADMADWKIEKAANGEISGGVLVPKTIKATPAETGFELQFSKFPHVQLNRATMAAPAGTFKFEVDVNYKTAKADSTYVLAKTSRNPFTTEDFVLTPHTLELAFANNEMNHILRGGYCLAQAAVNLEEHKTEEGLTCFHGRFDISVESTPQRNQYAVVMTLPLRVVTLDTLKGLEGGDRVPFARRLPDLAARLLARRAQDKQDNINDITLARNGFDSFPLVITQDKATKNVRVSTNNERPINFNVLLNGMELGISGLKLVATKVENIPAAGSRKIEIVVDRGLRIHTNVPLRLGFTVDVDITFERDIMITAVANAEMTQRLDFRTGGFLLTATTVLTTHTLPLPDRFTLNRNNLAECEAGDHIAIEGWVGEWIVEPILTSVLHGVVAEFDEGFDVRKLVCAKLHALSLGIQAPAPAP